MSERLLNVKQICERIGCSRSTLYRWRHEDKLPEPVKKWGSPRWNSQEIDEAMRQERRDKKI